jgi:L-asparaginase II
MSVPLINITRGSVVESIHRGDLVVVDGNGQVVSSRGDAYKYTYFRSAAKPIQAINVILSGAYKEYGISQKEMSVICSSHYAESFHIEAVQSILDKIGLDKKNILGGIAEPLSSKVSLQYARAGLVLDERHSDCSGKQSGMLSVCRINNYPIDDYLNPNHPCQQEILTNIARFCELDKEIISIGVDGCSAPVHALPLINMAIGFRNIANPHKLAGDLKEAADIIFTSMTKYPEMVSGTDGFCSELIKHSNGKLIGKVGAEGVYCIGIKDRDLGIALKIESGSMTVIPPVIMKTLIELDVLTDDEIEKLRKFIKIDNTNDRGRVVGYIEVV